MRVKNKENLIAFCGLYCGSCFIYQGRIADLARDLRKELRTAKFNRFADMIAKYWKPYKNYQSTYELLGMMVRLRCKRTCHEGGGPPSCKIRNCCLQKGIIGCWECDGFENCRKIDFLRAVHEDAHLKNLRKIRARGIQKFLQGEKYW